MDKTNFQEGQIEREKQKRGVPTLPGSPAGKRSRRVAARPSLRFLLSPDSRKSLREPLSPLGAASNTTF